MKSTVSIMLITCLVASALQVVAQGSVTSAEPPIGPLARTIARAAVRLAVTELNGVTEARLQSPDDNAWSQVRQLAAGEDVRVVLDGPASYRGTLRMADGQSITLAIASDDYRLSRARVRQVSVARATRRRRNILIGLVIGGATSAIAVGLHCRREASSCKEVAPAYFYPLAGAGAAIGALLPAAKIWQEVYARAEP
jgi:hypothetical protein